MKLVKSQYKEIDAFVSPVITAIIAMAAQYGIQMTDEQKFVVVLMGFILGVAIMISALFVDEWQKQRQFKNDTVLGNELARNKERLKAILNTIWQDRGLGVLSNQEITKLDELINAI